MMAYWRLVVAFVAFTLIVTSFAAVTVSKPLIVIVCALIIVSAVAVKLFDPAFAKKVTSATGN